MIISKKILIAAAMIPIIIALTIAIPKISTGGDQTSATATLTRIEFVKEDMKRITYGVTERAGAIKSESLIIDERGQAFYNMHAEGGKSAQTRFQINQQEMSRIKGMITDTGFMQIPKSEFAAKDDVSEFTRYVLRVHLDAHSKTVQWVDRDSAKDLVPPLLIMIGDTLTEIVEERT